MVLVFRGSGSRNFERSKIFRRNHLLFLIKTGGGGWVGKRESVKEVPRLFTKFSYFSNSINLDSFQLAHSVSILCREVGYRVFHSKIIQRPIKNGFPKDCHKPYIERRKTLLRMIMQCVIPVQIGLCHSLILYIGFMASGQ